MDHQNDSRVQVNIFGEKILKKGLDNITQEDFKEFNCMYDPATETCEKCDRLKKESNSYVLDFLYDSYSLKSKRFEDLCFFRVFYQRALFLKNMKENGILQH